MGAFFSNIQIYSTNKFDDKLRKSIINYLREDILK